MSPTRLAPAAAPLALAAVLVAGAAGCTTGRGGPTNTYVATEGSHEVERLVGSAALERDLEIRRYRSTRRDGFLVGQFELHNRKPTQIELEWSVEWFDGDGMEVTAGDRHWQPAVIGGKGHETVQIVAPTRDATSWRLAVRRPNPAR